MPGRTGAGPRAFRRTKAPFFACAVFARYIRNPRPIKQSSCRGGVFSRSVAAIVGDGDVVESKKPGPLEGPGLWNEVLLRHRHVIPCGNGAERRPERCRGSGAHRIAVV